MKRRALLLVISVIACSKAPTTKDAAGVIQQGEAAAKGVAIARHSAGSVQTNLGYGIRVNDHSSLKREWTIFNDSLMPATLGDDVGVSTRFRPGGEYSSGEYEYSSAVAVHTAKPVAALEVRFVLFDVWGDFVKTLSETEVQDIPADTTITFTPRWNVYSENEVSEYYASLAYIARVRTSDGKVFEARDDAVVAAVKGFARKFTPEDLDPDARRAKRDSSASHK